MKFLTSLLFRIVYTSIIDIIISFYLIININTNYRSINNKYIAEIYIYIYIIISPSIYYIV